ncbi:MAG: hypothetical protein RL318_231, partial [Fibrobacterota bacterium]
MNAWLYLVGTIAMESTGIALLNKAGGFSKPQWLALGLLFLNLGMLSFSMALKTLDMTIANTTWAGLSILLVAAIGFIGFGERYSLVQYSFIA